MELPKMYVVEPPLDFKQEQWGVYRNYWGGRELMAWCPDASIAQVIAQLLEEGFGG